MTRRDDFLATTGRQRQPVERLARSLFMMVGKFAEPSGRFGLPVTVQWAPPPASPNTSDAAVHSVAFGATSRRLLCPSRA